MGSEIELILPKQLDNLGEIETKLKSNGLYHVEDANEQLLEEIEIGSSSPAVNKSSGLRKWRRRPRDLVKKTGSSLTSRENGDPTASLVHNSTVHVNGDPLIQPGFATGPNSGQSDWSSFVASGPRVINEVSYLTGGNSVLPDDQQRNGGNGTGKKARGFNMENENLNSTMGSDSRSSNFVFLQDIQSGIFGKHGEESSDDGHYSDKPLTEEAQNVFIKSDAESEDASLAADDSGKHEGSMGEDHLVESVKGLHSAQVEFEREVQKWRDVGKDEPLTFDDLLHEILDLKDSKILKLESILNSGDIATKIDDLLMKMIQTEVEYVVLTTRTKLLTEGPLHEIKHDDLQQKTVSFYEKQDGKLQTEKEIKKVQNKVYKFTLCFIIMLILLLATLYLQFAPQNVKVVPT